MGYQARPGKTCKRWKRRLRTFCRKSRYFEDILSRKSRIFDREKKLKMKSWGRVKEIWGWIMENGGLSIQKWGWGVLDWGYTIYIQGFYHASLTFNKSIFGRPLSQITLFWGHFKTLNFPLEDILQLFPGLYQAPLWQNPPYREPTTTSTSFLVTRFCISIPYHLVCKFFWELILPFIIPLGVKTWLIP